MNQRLWINVCLLIAIVILFVIIQSDEPEPIETGMLSTLDKNAITQIEIERTDKPALQFVQTVDDWQLTAPMQFRVNPTRINAMLELVDTETYGSYAANELELDRFDLDPPQVTLTLNEHTFAFGTTDGIDQRRYVLFNDRIHLTDDYLFQQLMTGPVFFADLSLLPEKETIRAIQFPDNRLEKINDAWAMNPPLDIKPDQIKQLIATWQSASAVSAKKLEDAQTDLQIKIETENNHTMTYHIMQTEPYLVLGRKDLGIQFNIGNDIAGRLLLQENPPATVETESATDFFISE